MVGTRAMIPRHHISDLEAAGFVVVTADYSLCPQVSLYDGAHRDAKDAYRWCKETLPGLLAKEGVAINPAKLVVVGYSAGGTLSLVLVRRRFFALDLRVTAKLTGFQGAEPDPPVAVVNFYSPMYFQDSFWVEPLKSLSALPDFPEDFLNKIHDEPLRTFTKSSLERSAAARAGPPKPDLSVPRNAWLFTILKNGTHLQHLVPDGNLHRVDPSNGFSEKFPPTFFLHGSADDWVIPKFSEQAHQKLKGLGVETRIAILPGLIHGFDAMLTSDDPRYASITESFEFLKKHVDASSRKSRKSKL